MIPALFCVTVAAGFGWLLACPRGRELPGWMLVSFALGVATTMAILGG